MSLLPLFLKMNDVAVLVVGGGAAAERKVKALTQAGARVTVLSPVLDDLLAARVAAGEAVHLPRAFDHDFDPAAYRLVIAAGSPERNAAVAAWAERHRLWVNAVDDPEHCSALWPAVVDRGSLKVAIGSGGGAPVLARRVRARIEQLLPEGIGRLVDLAASFRPRVARRFRSFDARRRFWERAFERWDDDGASDCWETLLECMDQVPGHVHLVGAGPGNPDLLTLRALQVMQTADVIVHDGLVTPAVLARARRDAEFIPVGKAPGGPCVPQARINEILVDVAKSGRSVCRLKGGDPLVFGRAGEEIEALRGAGIAYSVVPGITAALGCAASIGVSLTHRELSHALVLATAHGHDERALATLADLAGGDRTLAVYMGVRQLGALAGTLLARGLPAATPVTIVENGARRDERHVAASLADVVATARRERIRSPALIFIGSAMGGARVAAFVAPAAAAG